jgi:hypothetical protein
VRTLRGLTFIALSTVTALALTGVLGSLQSSPVAAATPHWQTTASYPPLTNVRAVSCAPTATPGPATCVAVGDDGGHVASIIVTNDGGVHGVLSVCCGLLRRWGLGNHQVNRRRFDVDHSGSDVSGPVDLMLHH